jgi:hypothetical protein
VTPRDWIAMEVLLYFYTLTAGGQPAGWIAMEVLLNFYTLTA